MFDDYSSIAEVVNSFKGNPSALHPLVKAANNPDYSLVDLPEVEAKLARVKAAGLLTKGLKRHLMNPEQFFPTIAEIDVILHLMGHGLKAQWGPDPPDIEIPSLQTDIEVKCLSVADKLKNARNGEVVALNDIRRMRIRIRREVLPRIRDNHAHIVILNAEGFGFDEFEDLLLDVGCATDPKTNGLFCRSEYGKVSAAVLMKEPFLWPRRKRVPLDLRISTFAGILNPGGEIDVPVALRKALNIVSLKELRHCSAAKVN